MIIKNILKPKNIFPFLICFFLFFFFGFCQAAVLYLEPASGEYQPGDTFVLEVKIDAQEQCINTVKANLKFSQNILKAVDFSQGDSILLLWPEPPVIDQGAGSISFSGGIPGGYCGRIAGDPGESNLLGRIIFKIDEPREIKTEVNTDIEFLEGTQVLLNDGLGTPAKLSTKGAFFTILPEKVGQPKDEWQEELEKDNIPPEVFQIEIHQESSIFEGKYFITFFTTDKQTGIDHYEICEHTKPHECEYEKTQNWKRGESPYLLKDQSLKSIIKVKAVDKAGNERIAELFPPEVKRPVPWWIIIIIVFGLIFVGRLIYKIIKRVR